MIFSYNWLKDYVKNLPKPEKLAELLTMRSFEVAEVKKTGKDWALDIDILPNRPDCLSHFGMAGEITAITGQKLTFLRREKLKVVKDKIPQINLKIQCPKLVSRYSAIVIKDVKVDKSPPWLAERLRTAGINSINNIVDLTNFVMLETGQPLHAFDYGKIHWGRMILRQSKKGERVRTLDDIERKLDDGALIIEDKDRLIDLVGIMGGKSSEIDFKTKSIVLQAGNFDRRIIYQTAKKLAHRTSASDIYSQGIDPSLTISSLERAHFLLNKLGGGKIVQLIDIYPKKVYPKRIKLDLNYLKSLLGIEISEREVKNILTRLGVKIMGVRHPLLVEVPTRRLDISIPEDLIEEIGRIYGYEKIPPAFPVAALIPSKRNEEIFWENMVKDILKEAGFTEVYNYSFVADKGELEVTNPISSEYKYLRASLVPGLLKNVQKNLNNFPLSPEALAKGEGIKIFELGKVFGSKSEKRLLAGAVSSPNFYYLKGVVDSLLQKLGISDAWYDDYGKRTAAIKADGKDLGCLTENSFELDFDSLQKLCSEEHEYRPLSKFPALIRDLAVLVPRQVKVVEVLNLINAAGGPLVRDIDVFDIYEGEELPSGKKNLAFHIVYQSEEKTLKSEEVEKINRKIIKALERNPEWEARK